MAGASFKTKGVLIGAAAVVLAYILVVDFGGPDKDIYYGPNTNVSDRTGVDEGEKDPQQQSETSCWWGKIIVDVTRIENEEKYCDNPEQSYLGKATVELQEDVHIETATIPEVSQLVTREVGRKADLYYSYLDWSIKRPKWLRRCWAENDPAGEQTDRPTGMWEYDGFDEYGRAWSRYLMGTIYYEVGEDWPSGYGYDAGEYYFSAFPQGCSSDVDFSVAASPWMGSRVDVPCDFGDHFWGIPFIINKHNRPELFAYCKQDPPFLIEVRDRISPERTKLAMKGELSCNIPPEGFGPSRLNPTARYKVSWDLRQSSCKDWDYDGMTILQ